MGPKPSSKCLYTHVQYHCLISIYACVIHMGSIASCMMGIGLTRAAVIPMDTPNELGGLSVLAYLFILSYWSPIKQDVLERCV